MAGPGYLKRKIAESVEEALQHNGTDHIKTITKSAIQRYVQSFMERQGGNRSLMEAFSRQGLQYIVDQSFDPESDRTLRKVQLARMFEQIRQELPAILIMDNAFEIVPTNWIGIDSVYRDGQDWYGKVVICRNLGITLTAGTRDQSSCDLLHGLLSVLFGEMRFLGNGNRMTGNRLNGENWVVTISQPTLGTVSKEKIEGDSKDSIFFFSMELENVMFEDHVWIKQSMPRFEAQEGILNEGGIGLTPPRIEAPEEIRIHESAQVLFDSFQPTYMRAIISDPNIATYEPHSQTIRPRRLGTFELQVIRPGYGAQQSNGAKDIVVASKTIRVIP